MLSSNAGHVRGEAHSSRKTIQGMKLVEIILDQILRGEREGGSKANKGLQDLRYFSIT